MNWQDVINYIKSKDVSTVGDFKGLSMEYIRGIEEKRGIKLPQFYVDFLLIMGASMGKLNKSIYNYNLQEILADGNADYSDHKYFKIAQAKAIDWDLPPDYYLDLSTSDGLDAQIVGIKGSEQESDIDVAPKNFTFGDSITEDIFLWINHKYKQSIFVHTFTKEEANARMKISIDWFTMLGFTPLSLPSTPQSKYFRFENVDIAVVIRQHYMLLFELVSDDKESLDKLAKKIMSGTQGAELL